MKTIKLINNNESEKKMKNMRYEGFRISHNKKLLKTEKEKKRGYAFVPIMCIFLPKNWESRFILTRIYENEKLIWSDKKENQFTK